MPRRTLAELMEQAMDVLADVRYASDPRIRDLCLAVDEAYQSGIQHLFDHIEKHHRPAGEETKNA